MKTASDQLKADLKALTAQAVQLFNAMQVEQYPDRMEAHFANVLKKDYAVFLKTLPSFAHTYQTWYATAQGVIRRFLPGRITDFTSLYEPAKNRKEIRPDNYVIEDYLKNVVITAGFDKKVVAWPGDAIPVFQQQMNILNSVADCLESRLYDIDRLLQSELLDAELNAARDLAKNKFLRSAGAICSVVLIRHFQRMQIYHQLKFSKKNPTIKDYNELFKANETYTFPEWRFISYLHDLWFLCCRNKKDMPTAEQVDELIGGVEKVIKTLF
ncbi:hypothetical protein SAMN05216464_1273 [Mucilaginibacter pineti]|uniref:Uncharacterized protein n=1 Tax=Mucilaginibacter pineti TaxID=1391627 RepID=A0A1G7NGB5_9SPHI|nr:hypothetical protein [Mucilaginibacter pineti]SDF72951.1 hypothetical protein SAMN05216464_1273 [Mucilaginibacter pineti]